MDELVRALRSKGVLKSARIAKALREIDRQDFISEDIAHLAYEDTALPIGHGQTISQPYTVVFMLELLKPKAGEYIIDIGAGSAWQSALIAHIVGAHGQVYAIEVIKDLCALGRKNIAKYPDLKLRTTFFYQNAITGLPDVAADIGGFHGIIAAAEVLEVPTAWRDQLRIGGRLVYPQAGAIIKEMKRAVGDFTVEKHPGFVFVPFVSE